jgi:hypothetical protein
MLFAIIIFIMGMRYAERKAERKAESKKNVDNFDTLRPDMSSREDVSKCISLLYEQYQQSQDMSYEMHAKMADRACCPVSRDPCPYNIWIYRSGRELSSSLKEK